MSITLDRLRALKRQAGAPPSPRRQTTARHPNAAAVPDAGPVAKPGDTTRTAAVAASTSATPDPGSGSAAPLLSPLPSPSPPRSPSQAPALSRSPRSPSPSSSSPSPPTATSLDTLRRLLGVRERKPAYPAARGPVDRSLPGEEIAPGLRLIEAHLPFAAPTEALPLAFAKRDDAVDARDLLFFDTETTGLAGGTGTRAFQIGAADWHVHPVHGDGLRVRQLLITTLAAETAMLREFARWLSPATVLSSYNGRCYDAPLLKTRYRLARLACPITPLDHVDLLFPTRRRYRGVWENCRLATIERRLLGIVREDDLPGSEAPAAWLSYLRGGSSALLRRVCAHNHQDVVTLARLMLRLVEVDAGTAQCRDPQGATAATPAAVRPAAFTR